MKKLLVITALLGTCLLSLTGCGNRFIENPDDKYKLVACSDKELVQDIFYAKSGTKFYQIYKPNGSIQNVASKQSNDRIFWVGKDKSLIPTLYSNELLAYASQSAELKGITLERMKDVGYSFGFYGATYNEDGYISFNSEKQGIVGSSAYEVFYEAPSVEIKIATINDEPVTQDMLDSSGTILGLEEGKSYEVGYYAGTYYGKATIAADIWYLQSYEIYSLNKIVTTKNGYLGVQMPDDYKSGYYFLNGMGIFKYYNFAKGQGNETEVDINEAYYQSAEEQMSVYSQQFLLSVPVETNDVTVNVEYNLQGTDYTDADVSGIVSSPDGTQYEMTASEGLMSCSFATAMSGKWTVNVSPKDVLVKNVSVDSAAGEEAALQETSTFVFDEEQQNIKFSASYTGAGEVWGVINLPDGTTRDFTTDTKTATLSCTINYVPAGTYIATIYHYVDTSISEVTYGIDESTQTTEVITIVE